SSAASCCSAARRLTLLGSTSLGTCLLPAYPFARNGISLGPPRTLESPHVEARQAGEPRAQGLRAHHDLHRGDHTLAASTEHPEALRIPVVPDDVHDGHTLQL